MSPIIWWLRRDLRLIDNQVLLSAFEQSHEVIPLFIIDPYLQKSPYFNNRRWDFLLGCLVELDKNLQLHGSRLILRQGKPLSVLRELIRESGADFIYAEQDVTPYARKRDSQIGQELPVRWIGFPTVHPPGSVFKPNGEPYTVFTHYLKAWKQLPFPFSGDVRIPDDLSTPPELSSLIFPSIEETTYSALFPGGENEANIRLDLFCNGHDAPIYRYGEARNLLSADGTSGLSPYIRFGCISPRRVASYAYRALSTAANLDAQNNAKIWLDELIWREFYNHILYHFPYARKQSFRSNLRSIKWINDQDQFTAWCQGKTGYPVIDAAMRQLQLTGWMHNRARMFTASFLVKDLLIDWRWGEKWFMRHLIDGDPAANNGGWQWTAGTGTDAAPYFRVFNPVLQSKKFDPNGKYIREWLPELACVPDQFIHEPWNMSPAQQKEFRCIIGQDYPTQLVKHQEARKQMINVFREAKDASE